MNKLQKEKAEITEKIDSFEDDMDRKTELEGKIKDSESILKSLPTDAQMPDIANIEIELGKAEEEVKKQERRNEIAIQLKKSKDLEQEYLDIKVQADAISTAIDTLRSDVVKKLTEEAAIPIPDLNIVGEDIYLGDKQVDNLSTAEQVDFVVTITEWLNKDKPLKVVCLDRAEVLDPETLDAFAARIPDDYRFFISIVSHGEPIAPGSYVAKEGEVVRV